MKKVLKVGSKLLLGMLIGFVVCSTVVYAQILISSTEVTYTPTDSLFKTTNTKEALDDLYDRVDKFKDIPKFCQLESGTLGAIGSKYACDPGDGVVRNFYILKTDNEYVEMLMDRNLDDTNSTYIDALRYFKTEAGINLKNSWTNVLDVSFPRKQSILDIAYNTFNVTSLSYNCLNSKNQQNSCYTATNVSTGWLFEHLYGCVSYGCSDQSGTTDNGYWIESDYYIRFVKYNSKLIILQLCMAYVHL